MQSLQPRILLGSKTVHKVNNGDAVLQPQPCNSAVSHITTSTLGFHDIIIAWPPCASCI